MAIEIKFSYIKIKVMRRQYFKFAIIICDNIKNINIIINKKVVPDIPDIVVIRF